MIVIAGFLIGVIFGGILARKQGGSRLDIAQYAFACAIIGLLLGLFVTIVIERMV